MLDLKKYPKALQLLMQTDGTVTELIKILSNENIAVIKLLENIDESNENVMNRHIFLQGMNSKQNWLYAESKIHLDNLPVEFVSDLVHKAVPIGTLWINYRMETFKQLISQQEEVSNGDSSSCFPLGTKILSRVYQVFNKGKVIMEIKEKFPLDKLSHLL